MTPDQVRLVQQSFSKVAPISDQAAKLFSQGKAKDTFFMDREGLQPHVTSTKKLDYN